VPKKRKVRAPLVPLTGKQKSHLRSLAHSLKPVVQVGHQGLTAGVVAALETALERHELIKVKVSGEAEVEAEELAPAIAKATHSQLAQIIGHTLVIYRRRDENPKIVLPKIKAAKTAPAAPSRGARPAPGADDDEDDADDDADDDDDLE
jgi:RNA-binding protein